MSVEQRCSFVAKHRRRNRGGLLSVEATDTTILETGEVLHTLSIEGDDLNRLVALRERLGAPLRPPIGPEPSRSSRDTADQVQRGAAMMISTRRLSAPASERKSPFRWPSTNLRHHGHMRHIGLGRTLDGTRVISLIDDLDIRVIHHRTGEVIRAVTIDPNHRDHGTGQPPGGPSGPRKRKNPNP